MEEQQNDNDYSSVLETLISTFGEVLSEEAIISIVESCDGKLEVAADVIMNITAEGSDFETEKEKSKQAGGNALHSIEKTKHQIVKGAPECGNIISYPRDERVIRQGLSYASTSTSGAVPKQMPKTAKMFVSKDPEVVTQIMNYHINGTRTLIIMRGAPGSGKSFLAKHLIERIYDSRSHGFYSSHIFSADDFFSYRGVYRFDKSRLSEAHSSNQTRAFNAMKRGLSPVIVDNTNIEIWEMEPYVREGVKNGYIIILLEPNTPWAWKVNQLVRRTVHNVPEFRIKRMLDNYQHGLTGSALTWKLGCTYPGNMIPPVLRNIPPFIPNPILAQPQLTTGINMDIEMKREHGECNNTIEVQMEKLQVDNSIQSNICTTKQGKNKGDSSPNLNKVDFDVISGPEDDVERYIEVQKHLEEIEKVENEWENGENWEDNSNKSAVKENELIKPTDDVKPQRQTKSSRGPASENLLAPYNNVVDWSTITMFMPPWINKNNEIEENASVQLVQKVSSSTCMEMGDTDISKHKNPLKIISAIPRDINEFYIPEKVEKIPEIRMLDKSTSTNNEIIKPTLRCKNEERHFIEFRKLFKNIAKSDLRYIFDNCYGDVNWAVEIVLGGIDNKELNTKNENDFSDSEIENEKNDTAPCECLAAYNIIPDKTTSVEFNSIPNKTPMSITNIATPEKRKIKKDNPNSDQAIQLKQQIEQNIVISDIHYSKHCLKIRKFRRGEIDTEEGAAISDYVYENSSEESVNESAIPNTNDIVEDSDDDPNSISNYAKKTICIDVCKDLISQLDEHFGWKDMMYCKNIDTTINIPISILHEINALWIESLMYQLAENGKQIDIMIQQDEEFARHLANKEEELFLAGREPGLPDLKEIMDMDLALSLYQRDVEKCTADHQPNDLAAILTRQKLNNIFPEIVPATLSQILMAHENNFKETVESLLVSTGRADVLEIHNGVSKFIMEKEKERQKLLERKNVNVFDEEWPALPESEVIDMTVVQHYREVAENHLRVRNMCHQKAEELVRRDMTQAASYYQDIAAYHMMKYEQANSCAAASLMHLHAANNVGNDTVDLHFLHVSEAMESLDMFLDKYIQRLRDSNDPKYHKLFFITGRGLHSNGRPRIKPAVKKRLRERGLISSESNPGLLTAKVCAGDKMTYQVSDAIQLLVQRPRVLAKFGVMYRVTRMNVYEHVTVYGRYVYSVPASYTYILLEREYQRQQYMRRAFGLTF